MAITLVLLTTFVLVGLAGYGAGVAAERGPSSRIGHYGAVDGSTGFVFDHLGTPAKLRFDGSEEILALTPERAPLGRLDMRRDDGRYVMRIYPEGRTWWFPAVSGGRHDGRI